MSGDGEAIGATIRLDRLLWYLRLSKTRSAAQALIAAGHVRLDGRRIDKAGASVRAGSVLVIPFADHSVAIRILHLPTRRGPAQEARDCYSDLNAAPATDSQEAPPA